MVDLHSHTDQSDGTLTPEQLVLKAREVGLEALAITDHDLFDGYHKAVPFAQTAGLELIQGIELSTRLDPGAPLPPGKKRPPSVHLLGYFTDQPPAPDFCEWIEESQKSRRKRNQDLIRNLQAAGLDITLEEVSAASSNMTGRPHFARVLLRKGYVSTLQEAFDRYLADETDTFAKRDEPSLDEGIARISAAGGLPSLAHPVRLRQGSHREELKPLLTRLQSEGLQGIEVWHSEHSSALSRMYLELAAELKLVATGGTDFHGGNKPSIALGSGISGNVSLPYSLLESLRERRPPPHA